MGGRSTNYRCSRCRMYQPLCLCADIPIFQLRTRIVVLMHWRERNLPTNTARLACLAMPNSSIHLRGKKDEPLDVTSIVPPGSNAALLYPSEDAVEITPEWCRNHQQTPLTLIVPDGNWGQASKVATREKALLPYPRIIVPTQVPSTYRLRTSPHTQNLSTFEAISRAIGILEGPEIQAQLDHLFLKMVERMLWSRGKLNAAESVTGIPEAAFLAARLAGIEGKRKLRSSQ